MKMLHRLVIICLAAGCATRAAAAESHAALYSFSDLYRLTVNGAAPESIGLTTLSTEAQPVRVATEQAAPATQFRFTITPVPGPGRWPLILAGLAAAAWVAHRRLTRPL